MPTPTTAGTSNITIDGNKFMYERVFNAPRDLVFEVYTSADHIKNWWGPEGWPVVYCTLDFKVGGRWHYCMKGEEGESWGIGIYDEINRPERIVYRDAFSDKDGTVVPPEMKIELDFKDQGATTLVTGTSHFVDAETLKQFAEMGMTEGMNSTLDGLDRYLAQLQSGAKS